jgi:Spy/CpxP family protein refolding chaperone
MTGSDHFERQMRAAREAMHRYRHALRALATGETVEEAREEMEREESEEAKRPR